jgi:hypothetical protein
LSEQGSLFFDSELKVIRHQSMSDRSAQAEAQMSVAALTSWKQRVFDYQQQVRHSLSPQQQGLFELADFLDPDSIDPYKLRQQNTEFYKWRYSDSGTAALYFVIDYELPIVLYIGQTAKSNQRWQGKHDCKDYLMAYREVHFKLHWPTALGTAFYPHAPALAKFRRKLEAALIHKWRSPFNRENAKYWSTPFLDN